MDAISMINTANIKNPQASQNIKNIPSAFSNLLNMILGEGAGEFVADSVDSNVNNKELLNLIKSCSQEENSSAKKEVDYNNLNLMGMIFGMIQNPINSEFQNSNFDISKNSLNLQKGRVNSLLGEIETGNVGNLVNLANIKDFDGGKMNHYYFNNATNIANNLVVKDTANNLSSKDNSFAQNNFNLKSSMIVDNQVINMQNNSLNKMDSPVKGISNEAETKTEFTISNKNLAKEALLTANEKNVDITKADFRGNIVENKIPIYSENNKIIEISDQSSEIKNSVLSQVEDKIIFMASKNESKQEVTMELNPQNLGKINVKMSLESEKIIIQIMALDPKVGSILASNVNELVKSLEQNLNNGTVSVTVTGGELNGYNQSNLNYSQNDSQREQNQNKQSHYNNLDNVEESDLVSQIINMRNMKLNKVV